MPTALPQGYTILHARDGSTQYAVNHSNGDMLGSSDGQWTQELEDPLAIAPIESDPFDSQDQDYDAFSEMELEDDDLIEALEEEEDEPYIELETRAPVYPSILVPDVIYITGSADGNDFVVRVNSIRNGTLVERAPTLSEVWQIANQWQTSTPAVNGRSMSIYPNRNTPEYNYLQAGLHEAITEEPEGSADMPARTRAADGPYVIRVTWEPELHGGMFKATVPYNNICDYNHYYHTNPELAHVRARDFAGVLRNRDGNPWTVKPRRNTNEWRDLTQHINWTALPSASEQDEETLQLETVLIAVRDRPTSESTVRYIEEYVRRKVWPKIGNDQITDVINVAREALRVKIQEATGVNYIASSYEHYRLIHPEQVVLLHFGENHLDDYGVLEEHAPVSREYYENNGMGCGACGEFFVASSMMRINEGERRRHFCKDCYEAAGFYNCALCSTTHGGAQICERYNNMRPETIHSYNTDVRRVIPKMYHMPSDKLHNGTYLRYGVELELIATPLPGVPGGGYELNAARKVGEAIKHHAILKSDSSLSNAGYGFEVVSVPATLEYHRKKMWNKLFATDENGNSTLAEGAKAPAQYTKAWDTGVCGIHVHITRAAMTKMQLGKLCVFYNEPNNSPFLSRIAGRTVDRNAGFCKASKKRLGTKTTADCNDHHGAVAISHRNKGKTAEIRIFRGNASRHGVMRCIEFVDATVQWCAQNGAKQLHYVEFLHWFNKSSVRSMYPDLWKYLIQLGYLTTSHKSKGKKTLDLIPETARSA